MKRLSTYCSALYFLFLIAPGCNPNHNNTSDLLGNWSTAYDFLGDVRSEAASFVIADSAYVLTGCASGNLRYNDMYVFSLATNNWKKKASLPADARNGAIAFSINGKGYLCTGYNGANALNDCWEYDPGTDSWTRKDDLPADARYDAVGFAIGNKGYLCGGYSNKYFNDCWEFDPTAPIGSQWTAKASMPHKTYAAACFILNSKGYVISGTSNGDIQKEMFEFDPTQNVWTTKRPLYNYSNDSYDDHYTTIVRQNAVAFVISGYGYLATGSNGAYVANTWQYDASQDQWTEVTGFEAKPREGAVAFTLNNRGFVLTGNSGSLYMDNAFEFHPNVARIDGD